MDYVEGVLKCDDGRDLEYATLGDPSGPTIFFHHGTPGSNRLLVTLAPLLERGNFYFVTISRAGYGRSSRREGRAVADVVTDVRRVLDELRRVSYVALGWSGGGPHAIACAASDAPRCGAAVSLAGVAPIDAGFDWTEGMGPSNVEEFELAMRGGPEHEASGEAVAATMLAATEDDIVDAFDGLLSAPDLAVFSDRHEREVFAAAMNHAFVEGWRGFYDDDRAMMSSWGVDLGSIQVPVSIWYGDEDLMVPPTHGAWLSANIATATPRHHPGDGHLSIVTSHFDELASELLDLV
jgi:pimeloyl-ACP methyl ester carboxylesterase